MLILHVRRAGRRTSVSLDDEVGYWLALHLRAEPGTPRANAAIRDWCQEQVNADDDPGRQRLSQWLLGRVLETIAAPKLRDANDAFIDKYLVRR